MLTDENDLHDYCKLCVDNPKCFTQRISRGKLVFGSKTVFGIVYAAEKAFKFLVIKEKRNLNVNKEITFVTPTFARDKI